jgi:hypothetical protein
MGIFYLYYKIYIVFIVILLYLVYDKKLASLAKKKERWFKFRAKPEI